jgi:hypothetical protein
VKKPQVKVKRVKREKPAASPEDKTRDYSERLAELEAELNAKPARSAGTPSSALPTVSKIEPAKISGESVVRFVHHGKKFAVGHTDTTFPGTNESRGIRRVHLYDADDTIVLGAVGEFENHQFGANFRPQKLNTYQAGPWEEQFVAITDGLRTFRVDRKEELRLSRAKHFGRSSDE